MVVGVQSGFLYTGGQFQRIACPNNSNTLAQGINDDGVIVGWCSNPFPGPEQGFIYQNGSYSSVTYPGSTLTVLNGINRQGDLIGVYQLGQQSGFAYTAGSCQSLKGTRSGNGINRSQTIAATACGAHCHGVVKRKTTKGWVIVQKVLFPGARDSMLNGINDNGDLRENGVLPRTDREAGSCISKAQTPS